MQPHDTDEVLHPRSLHIWTGFQLTYLTCLGLYLELDCPHSNQNICYLVSFRCVCPVILENLTAWANSVGVADYLCSFALPPQACGNSSWLIPLGLSLPYLWRFCQCIRVNKDTGNRGQLYNAVKYSTAFPVVLFSYMNYHTDEQTWATFYRPLWILSALLNSAYSYYWDVERDWEVQWFSAPPGETPLAEYHVHLSQKEFSRSHHSLKPWLQRRTKSD